MTASDAVRPGLADDSADAFDHTGADISIPTDSPLGTEETDGEPEQDAADIVLDDEPLYTDSPDDPMAAEDTLAADPMADIRPGAEDLSDPEGNGLAAKLDVDPDRDDVKG